jgi:hypothetical protein
MKRVLTGWALFAFGASILSAGAATPASQVSACLTGVRTQLDDLTRQMSAIAAEPDPSSGVSGTGFIVAGECTRMLALMDRSPAETVPPREADRAERKACLELQKRKITNACKCNGLGDASAPDSDAIKGALVARKRFADLRGKVTAFGIKDPAVREYVDAASQIGECLSAKSMLIMDRVSDAIEATIMADTSPAVSPIYGATPSVSAINGGPPPVSAIDGGVQYARPVSPPDSTISGTAGTSTSYSSNNSSSSSSSDYRSSGAATNAAKDVLSFAEAYAKSSASLRAVAPVPHVSAPAPHVSAPPPRVSSPAPVYRPSGISGLKH